jgi:deoxyribodipyrimidine photolyase
VRSSSKAEERESEQSRHHAPCSPGGATAHGILTPTTNRCPQAKCVVGVDYPKPIVDHDVIHKTNITKMAAAYQAGKDAKEAAAPSKPAKKQKL